MTDGELEREPGMTITAGDSRPERLSTQAASPRTCEHCGHALPPQSRADRHFCNTQCRQAAWLIGAQEGRIASVRRLRNGKMSVVLHMPQDLVLTPGSSVRLGPVPKQEDLI